MYQIYSRFQMIYQFFQSSYEITVTEDEPVETEIFKEIIVTDKDSFGQNIVVTCINLPKFPDGCSQFRIQTEDVGKNYVRSAIILNKKLNYAEQPLIKFVLKATVSFLSNPNLVDKYRNSVVFIHH